MAVNQQQRGLLAITRPEIAARPASPQLRLGQVNLPTTGAEVAAETVGRAAASLEGELKSLGDQIGNYADHAARVEGEREGRKAGLDPEFRPTGAITIRGEAFDKAGMDVYRTTARLEIEADIDKGGDLGAKQRAWEARVPDEMRGEVGHMFRRAGLAKAREASRKAAAQAAQDAQFALQADIDAGVKGLHQRAYALGLDGDADALIAKDIGLLEGTLGRRGPDGTPLVSPGQRRQIMTKARETVADARLLGAFSRLETVEAKEAFVKRLDEDFKASRGIASIYDFGGFQRITRQLEAEMRSTRMERSATDRAVAEDVKSLGQLAAKGYGVTPDQIAGLRARAVASPELGAHIDQLEELAAWQSSARRQPPEAVDAYADNLEAVMRERGPNKAAAGRVEMARKLAEEMRTQLKTDPIGWADRTGLMKVAPLQLAPEAIEGSFRARIAQAEEVARYYGQDPVYLRPQEKRAIAQAASKGGLATMQVAETLARVAGDRAPRVLAEIAKDGPVVAMLGGHVQAVGRTAVADDVADGLALARTDGFKSMAPSAERARSEAYAVHGGALSLLPESEAAVISATNAAYELRARRRPGTEFDAALWQRTFKEVLGERQVDGRSYGGIASVEGARIVVPPNIRSDGYSGLVGALRLEDFGDAPPAYKDGRAVALADLRRARPVQIGDGLYRLNLGPADAPRYLMGANGEPFELDLKALEPVLKERRPDLYLGGTALPPPGAVRQRRPPGMMRLGGPVDQGDPGLGDYQPRFARAANRDLSAEPAETVAAWQELAEPYTKAFSVFSRALDAAMGKGEGVTQDEIREAGITLASLAHAGSLAGVLPENALGAGGRVIWTGPMLRKVADMRGRNMTSSQIAEELGVPLKAISNAASYHQLGASGLARLGQQRAAVIEEMWEQGARIGEIAQRLGVDSRTVQRTARRLGLDQRAQGAPAKEISAQAVRKQMEQGFEKEAIAAQHGVSVRTINRVLRDGREPPMMLGGPADDIEADAQAPGAPQGADGQPAAGLPPEIAAGVSALRDRFKGKPDKLAKLDDLLYSDHVLSGIEAMEMASDEAGREGIARRLMRDILNRLGEGDGK